MFVLSGARMAEKKNIVTGWGFCEHCEKYTTHNSYNGRRMRHVYYVPTLPSATPVRVVKECTVCSLGRQIPEKDVPAILAALRKSAEAALSALLAGQPNFDDQGQEKNCLTYLTRSVDFFCSIGCEECVEHIMKELMTNKRIYERELVRGHKMEFHGMLNDAEGCYREAHALHPERPEAELALASLYEGRENHAEALKHYEAVLAKDTQNIGLLNHLLGIYTKQECSDKFCDTFEACVELQPEIALEEGTFNHYASCCKNLERTQRVTLQQ